MLQEHCYLEAGRHKPLTVLQMIQTALTGKRSFGQERSLKVYVLYISINDSGNLSSFLLQVAFGAENEASTPCKKEKQHDSGLGG